MFAYLTTPIFSTFWGWAGIIVLIILTSVAAFPVFLAYHLRLKGWQIPAALIVFYVILSLDFPHPVVRTYIRGTPQPPMDVVRLSCLVLSLLTGLALVGIWALPFMSKQSSPPAPRSNDDL